MKYITGALVIMALLGEQQTSAVRCEVHRSRSQHGKDARSNFSPGRIKKRAKKGPPKGETVHFAFVIQPRAELTAGHRGANGVPGGPPKPNPTQRELWMAWVGDAAVRKNIRFHRRVLVASRRRRKQGQLKAALEASHQLSQVQRVKIQAVAYGAMVVIDTMVK